VAAQLPVVADAETQAPSVGAATDTKGNTTPDEACREIAALPLDQAEKLKTTLLAASPTISLTLRPEAEPQSYWVHLLPLRDAGEAEKKAEEIRKLGVSDYFVVQDEGPNRYAISLGLFRTEQAAKELLDRLVKKGVRTARIDLRQKSEKATLELRGPASQVDSAATDLLAKYGAHATECRAR
jgi:cell division septation protein DedD